MNTQGISANNDAWMQFVNVTREARKRQGIESTEAKGAISQKSPIKVNLSNYSQDVSVIKKFETNNSREPRVKTKILGGSIDTYA